METELNASVATFRVYTSAQGGRPLSSGTAEDRRVQAPPTRADRMAATLVTEGPLVLSRLATNEMSYLQVNNFTRAILPRSRIWRVSDSELVVPASFTNYWLITLQGSRNAIVKLDRVLRSLCKYEVIGETTEDLQAEEVEDSIQTDPQSPSTDLLVGREERTRVAQMIKASNERQDSASSSPLSVCVTASRDAPLVTQTSKGAISFSAPLESPEKVLVSPPASPTSSSSVGCLSPPEKTLRQLKFPPRELPRQVRILTPPEQDNVAFANHEACKEISTDPIISKSPAQSEASKLVRDDDSAAQGSTPSRPTVEVLAIAEPMTDKDLTIPAVPSNNTEPNSPNIATLEDPKSVVCSPLATNESSTRGEITSRPVTDLEDIPQISQDGNHKQTKALQSTSSILRLQKSLDSRFGPRFTHPLIPASSLPYAYPSASVRPALSPRLSLQRRELLAVGPNSLHQDVSTVGGYIGLKAVNKILRKT